MTHPQAALFRALAEHLDRFPTLPQVVVHRSDSREAAGVLQVAAFTNDPHTPGATSVLAWAETLTEPTITIRRHGTWAEGPDMPRPVTVDARGRIGGLQVCVWDVEDAGLDHLVGTLSLPAFDHYARPKATA